eukprot:6308868-Heterocapsa_arctica.AAC.2
MTLPHCRRPGRVGEVAGPAGERARGQTVRRGRDVRQEHAGGHCVAVVRMGSRRIRQGVGRGQEPPRPRHRGGARRRRLQGQR